MRLAALALLTFGMLTLGLAGALVLFEGADPELPAVGVTDERYLRGIERMWYGQ